MFLQSNAKQCKAKTFKNPDSHHVVMLGADTLTHFLFVLKDCEVDTGEVATEVVSSEVDIQERNSESKRPNSISY